MSEMMRNKGIIRRISTKEDIKEVYDKLVAEGKITRKMITMMLSTVVYLTCQMLLLSTIHMKT
jgi:hypothetical protein